MHVLKKPCQMRKQARPTRMLPVWTLMKPTKSNVDLANCSSDSGKKIISNFKSKNDSADSKIHSFQNNQPMRVRKHVTRAGNLTHGHCIFDCRRENGATGTEQITPCKRNTICTARLSKFEKERSRCEPGKQLSTLSHVLHN